MSEINKSKIGVVILAAGRGTRLGCVDIPKVMMEIGEKPIVFYIVETLEKMGFSAEQICLVVGYQKEKVMEYFGKRVIYAFQEELLGTAHAAYTGIKMLPQYVEEVLVIGG
ncbi:MAG: NTP transferase domain-containing protein, partial [Candidatus Magasanikbacteria bacterium]